MSKLGKITYSCCEFRLKFLNGKSIRKRCKFCHDAKLKSPVLLTNRRSIIIVSRVSFSLTLLLQLH